MINIDKIACVGGLFAVFTFVHFFVDWILQTHSEAMSKYNNALIRARHCVIYTCGFLPLLFLLKYSVLQLLIAINILFWSHFIEDTYYPVFLWAKYIRKPPEMVGDPRVGFIAFVSTPLGKILMIAVDQIIHLAFLFPIIWIIIK